MTLLAALVSCADEPAEEVDPGPPETSTPTSTGNGPDPESPTDKPTISLPSLPIGGNANESDDVDHPDNQCVDVNWIVGNDSGATLRDGVEVEITDVIFNPDVFVVSDAGCDDSNPPCTDFVFTEDAQVCNLAVEPTEGAELLEEDPFLELAGEVHCELELDECQAFADAAATEQEGNGPIGPLITPEVPPTDETTDPTETPSE